MSDNVRCPTCTRVLKPPANAARFRCPCGQILAKPNTMSTSTTGSSSPTSIDLPPPSSFPNSNITYEGRVKCPRCQTILITPPNAPLFRCTCGITLRSPTPVNNTIVTTPTRVTAAASNTSNAATSSLPRRNDTVHSAAATLSRPTVNATPIQPFTSVGNNVTTKYIDDSLLPDQVVAEVKKTNGEFWIRNLGPGEKLYWIRLMSAEQEEKAQKLLSTWEKDMLKNIDNLELYDLQVRIEQLGFEKRVKSMDDLQELKITLKSAKTMLRSTTSIKQLSDLLNNLNVEHTACVALDQYVERLMAAVWYGPTRLSDGFVREFTTDTDLKMTPAQQYGLPLDYKLYKITNDVLERKSEAPFKEKVQWFRELCDKARIPWEQGRVDLKINRADLLQDSFYKFQNISAADMRKNFKFEFEGEAGIDAGGLAREWFELVTDACFNVDCGLFEYSGLDNICYQFNPASGIANDLHNEYFQFIGRIVGKALFDQKFIKAHLTQPIFKHILGYPITMEDIQYCDQKIYDTLKEIEEMEDVSALMLYFSCTSEVFGEIVEVELKPGGLELEVTQANVQEYIMLMTKYYMFERTKSQLGHFLKGIYEIIPEIWLSVFDYRELELLLCGLPNINVQDWKANTKYRGNYHPKGEKHKVIKWFWEYVESCDQEARARLLQFCTGTSRVPIAGFGALQGRSGQVQNFTIEAVSTTKFIYPRAHTCFNRIDLPEYKTKKEMIQRLEEATSISMTGFNDE